MPRRNYERQNQDTRRVMATCTPTPGRALQSLSIPPIRPAVNKTLFVARRHHHAECCPSKRALHSLWLCPDPIEEGLENRRRKQVRNKSTPWFSNVRGFGYVRVCVCCTAIFSRTERLRMCLISPERRLIPKAQRIGGKEQQSEEELVPVFYLCSSRCV